MTSTEQDQQQGRQQAGGLVDALKNNPAVAQLGQAAKDYAKARGQDAAKKVGDKLTGVTGSLTDKAESGGFKATAVSKAVEKVAQGESPVKASLAGVGEWQTSALSILGFRVAEVVRLQMSAEFCESSYVRTLF